MHRHGTRLPRYRHYRRLGCAIDAYACERSNMGMKRILTALLLLTLAAPAWRQDYEKGMAAYDRGDYATALREFRPLAEQGHVSAF